MDALKRLMDRKDEGYRAFHAPLVPTVDRNTILGVRSPDIKAIAKEIKGTPEAEEFLHALPHTWFDENQLHMALIEITPRTPEEALKMLDEFLPYVDNWSTCDSRLPKVLKKDLPLVHEKALRWMESSHVYTKRYAINLSFKLFLGEDTFAPDLMERISMNGDEDYYIKMSSSWYWAEALNKQREAALPYFLDRKLYPWIHNRALQKALESRHFTTEEKNYFRSLKLKGV